MSPGVFLFRVVITLLCALGAINVAAFFVAYFRPDLLPRFYQLFLGRKVRVQAEYVDDDEPAKAVAYAAPDISKKLRVYVSSAAYETDAEGSRLDRVVEGLEALENIEVVGPGLADLREGVDVFWLLRPLSGKDSDPWVELGYATRIYEHGVLHVVVSGNTPPELMPSTYTERPRDWREGDPAWIEVADDDLGLAAVQGFATAHASLLKTLAETKP